MVQVPAWDDLMEADFKIPGLDKAELTLMKDNERFTVQYDGGQRLTGLIADYPDIVEGIITAEYRLRKAAGAYVKCMLSYDMMVEHEEHLERLSVLRGTNYNGGVSSLLQGLNTTEMGGAAHDLQEAMIIYFALIKSLTALMMVKVQLQEVNEDIHELHVSRRRIQDATDAEINGLKEHVDCYGRLLGDPPFYDWLIRQGNIMMPGIGKLTHSWIDEVHGTYVEAMGTDNGPLAANQDHEPNADTLASQLLLELIEDTSLVRFIVNHTEFNLATRDTITVRWLREMREAQAAFEAQMSSQNGSDGADELDAYQAFTGEAQAGELDSQDVVSIYSEADRTAAIEEAQAPAEVPGDGCER